MNGNKVNINKIVEIAAGVIAVLVALGELLSSILSPVMSFANSECS